MYETLIQNRKKSTSLSLLKKILIVEHENDFGNFLLKYLQAHNFETHYSHNGMKARDIIEYKHFDIILIDMNLPFKDAFSLESAIKNSKPNIPIIFISNNINDKQISKDRIVLHKDNFTNDFEEALILIDNKTDNSNEIEKINFTIGKFELNSKFRLLSYDNENPVRLSHKENKLLRILIENKGNLVTKELLIKKVWYDNYSNNLKSIGVYITKMRKLLAKDKALHIQNIYKTGFILTEKTT